MRVDLSSAGETPADFERFLSSFDEPPVHSLQLNTLRGADRSGLPFSLSDPPIPWNPDGFYYEETDDNRPGRHPLHDAGAFYIQEASAMLPARMLLSADNDSSRHLRVLDLCAAPGGKSVQLALTMRGQGLLVSNEIHPARAKILSQNIERMGIRNAIVLNESPERLAAAFPAFFDRILVDAPCSGEGMFRKNPEAIREWSPDAVRLCAERQRTILRAAADMLAPGGRLVYSTCTFAPAEDEEQIASFLADHPDFTPEKQEKLLPHRIHGEGHFSALLLREGTVPIPDAGRFSAGIARSGRAGKGAGSSQAGIPGKALAEEIRVWLSSLLCDPVCIDFDPARLILFGDHLYLVPPCLPDLHGLRVLRPGLHLADIRPNRKENRIEPAHALSHALSPSQVFRCAELTDDEAAAFLNGQTLRPDRLIHAGDVDGTAAGYVLMCCRGFSLGWARAGAGMLKNRYPKGIRTAG
ncbi:MAG: RsmF rRNA methyltransferase first C-terminal domain-containing protein [Lachnospiraceae bacterium]|nr:RsmF rRNA methyltransferase first C-terminal domain-containing protein [Lachnospiraceae bacterium]